MKRLIKRFLWILCRAWLFGGAGTIAVGLGFGVYNIVFLCRSVSATGTIESFAPVVDHDDGGLTYAPIFTFMAQDGHSYTVRADLATNPPGFVAGQTVRVLYLRTDPAGAKLGTFGQLWFETILSTGLGLFFSGTGYLLLRYERRRQQHAAIATTSAISPI